jgi:hypothetical protein
MMCDQRGLTTKPDAGGTDRDLRKLVINPKIAKALGLTGVAN